MKIYLLICAAFTFGWLLCAAMSEMHKGWMASSAERLRRQHGDARDPQTGLYI